jgi:hypothetical protein
MLFNPGLEYRVSLLFELLKIGLPLGRLHIKIFPLIYFRLEGVGSNDFRVGNSGCHRLLNNLRLYIFRLLAFIDHFYALAPGYQLGLDYQNFTQCFIRKSSTKVWSVSAA